MSTDKKNDDKKKCCILAVSRDGVTLGLRVKRLLDDFDATLFTIEKYAAPGAEILPGKLSAFWQTAMQEYDTLICIMASGIVVRGIAPYLKHKSVDPAVLVLDSAGKYVVPLLSGHLGGANDMARLLAKRLGAKPVITTGTDVKGSMAVDVLAQKIGGMLTDFNGAKEVTADILDGKPVMLFNDADVSLDGIVLPQNMIVADENTEKQYGNHDTAKSLIVISDKALESFAEGQTGVQIIAKTIVCGVGCKKNTPKDLIVEKINAACAKIGVSPKAIGIVATVGLKAHEAGLLSAAEDIGADVKIISDEFVKLVQDKFDGSDFVEKVTGMRAVSEPCGYVASKFGDCLLPVQKGDGVTISLWKARA